jgi:hypothetical protein
VTDDALTAGEADPVPNGERRDDWPDDDDGHPHGGRSLLDKIGHLMRSTIDGEPRTAGARDVGLVTTVECDPESLRPVRVVGAYTDRRTALARARTRGARPVLVVPLLFDCQPLTGPRWDGSRGVEVRSSGARRRRTSEG